MKNLIVKLLLLSCLFVSCSKKTNVISTNEITDLATMITEKHRNLYKDLNPYEQKQLYHTIVAGDIIRKKILSKARITNIDTSECYLLEMTRSVDYAYIGYYFFNDKNLMYKVFYRPPYDSLNKIRDLVITTKHYNRNSCIISAIEEELDLKKNIANCESESSYIATKFNYDIKKTLILRTAFFCRREDDKKQIIYLMNINKGCD